MVIIRVDRIFCVQFEQGIVMKLRRILEIASNLFIWGFLCFSGVVTSFYLKESIGVLLTLVVFLSLIGCGCFSMTTNKS